MPGDLSARLRGRTVERLETYGNPDSDGPIDGEVRIAAVVFTDGSRLELTGSGQHRVDDVWANLLEAGHGRKGRRGD